MKKGMKKKLLAVVLLGILMLGLLACEDGQVDSNRFDVKLKSGYGNSVEIGSYAPFYVEITNNGTDFEGAVQLIIPGQDNKNTMYQKDIAISAGDTKTVELVGNIETVTRQVKVNILNNKDTEIWSSLENCNTVSDLKNVNVGILSDDYSALGYMDHKTFTANKELTTCIYELTKDTMPSDWHALQMLDVIVVSDFSTDALSDAQLNALGVWVNEGGLLMVGTGSTANKTLASLNGRFFDVKVGELESYHTKFGLWIADYTYNYGYENSYNSPYNDSLYTTFFEENYESLRDAFEEEYMDQFKIDYYYDDTYYTWDEYWEDSFYWYCYDNFYASYLISIGENGGNYAAAEAMPYVKADVLELSGNILEDDNTSIFLGESEDNSTFNLAYAIEQGEGYVLLSGVDFTKTPLSNYEGNAQLFIHWVESLIGEKCYNEVYDYGNYYYNDINYDEEQIYYGAVTAKVPPILIYVGILIAYVIAILVIYLVARRKKKTVNLWVVYPAVATGLTLLIFCIGFSTRIYRPIVGAITLITPNGSMTTQKTFAAVTVPNNKAYEVGFSPEQGVQYMNLEYSYYYGDDEIQWDKYEVGYIYNYDSVDVVLGEHEAMANVYFALDTICAEQRNVIVYSDNGVISGLEVTNEYGCDLESAVLVVDNDVYIIGDMKNGETVELSDMTLYRDDSPYSYNYSVPNLGTVVYEDESWKVLLGLVFGSASSAYDDYLCKYRAMNAVTDYADRYEGPDVVFIALPTESTAMPLQTTTNYNERRVEMIYVEYELSNYQSGY